ncbi:anaerobic glycerol-3-phosphate dehydrogenase subunit b [Anaeramoeba ignava]|uniref:Anaerobic glycerol-3-phosphate dehydrogenase subunit b n=1 Tax=Anaeramoeba ignava TaxID=1746090 RepID=A0A9Q0LPS7_ANAIG|nr:anaerobic glycerol-3-phosphate dehydrogenase subunit b [Anaeramoeba ignava]|eukprot:Anaeramoba_ignava/a348364_618.p1 GENE.a348364_618~~a348364_618.p1  ORF type:complete len:714 (+),score=213.60 a348364_618:42-2183(+)
MLSPIKPTFFLNKKNNSLLQSNFNRFIKTGAKRILEHPVLEIPQRKEVSFQWNGKILYGYEGEMLSSALIANGEDIFGFHYKDKSPQGIFCANGQCSQCMVTCNGVPVKSCMTPLKEGMVVNYAAQVLPEFREKLNLKDAPKSEIDVLIIGGGPSGLSAACELGKKGVKTLLIDDKDRLGGKLVLQTHKFFGSSEECYAGTRGYKIGGILTKEVEKYSSVQVALNSTAVAVFSDKYVGIVSNGEYKLVKPKKLLVAAGAREKFLSFPGNTLPGVYGAGAFQTLVNRDLVRSSNKVLIVGGGNVGLIGGYHAIQAGIEVVCLIEAMDHCGGYKVHEDKLRRLGVPILTRHTIVGVTGKDHVEKCTIAQLDNNWKIIPGTYKTYDVDTVLLAVGLEECKEFYKKAQNYGIDVFSAGDAQEIAEASAAMFTGKIEGRKILKSLGIDIEIPEDWDEKVKVLKSKPKDTDEKHITELTEGVFPVFHCHQEIPCNACVAGCSLGNISMGEENDIKDPPIFRGDCDDCNGCLRCVTVCPGLAVTLVDFREDAEFPTVTFPYEVWRKDVEIGKMVPIMDEAGLMLGKFKVENVQQRERTLLVSVKLPKDIAKKAASVFTREIKQIPDLYEKSKFPDESIVCRCERVSAKEIRDSIRLGVTDMNQLKAATRACMGACGSKTCFSTIKRIFREEGIPNDRITDRVERPLFVEVPLGAFAGMNL